MPKILPRPQVRTMLENLTEVDMLLDDCVARLFVNDIQPGPNSVLADFEEASFPGYAASSALTWSPPYSQPDGGATVDGGAYTVVCSGSTDGQEIFGYYITKSGVGGALVYSERIAEPIIIAQVGDGGTVIPRFNLKAIQ